MVVLGLSLAGVLFGFLYDTLIDLLVACLLKGE